MESYEYQSEEKNESDSSPNDIDPDKLISWFSNFEQTDDHPGCTYLLFDLNCNLYMKNELIGAIENLNEEFTDEEECQLEAHYHINSNPNPYDLQELASQVEKNTFSIKSWFSRRRAYDILYEADEAKTIIADENSNVKNSKHNEASKDVGKENLLKSLFKINPYPTRGQIRELSVKMNVCTWVIDEWFYNYRTIDRCLEAKESLNNNHEYNVHLREHFLPLPQSDRNFTWSEIDFLEIYIDANSKPSLLQIEQITYFLNVDWNLVDEWFTEHQKVHFQHQSIINNNYI